MLLLGYGSKAKLFYVYLLRLSFNPVLFLDWLLIELKYSAL
jgi:hypothetical protein